MGTYFRLIDYKSAELKKNSFSNKEIIYKINQNNFKKIPGNPIAYWISKSTLDLYEHNSIDDYAETAVGLFTCNNEKFLKLWSEISFDRILFYCSNVACLKKSKKVYIPYNKGGGIRKWYGLNGLVVYYKNDGEEIRKYRKASGQSFSLPGHQFYFKKGITWSGLSNAYNSFRYTPKGFIFDSNKGQMMFSNRDIVILPYLNSKVLGYFVKIINSTMSTQSNQIKKIPFISEINLNHKNTRNLISISKSDWDLRETSWDFRRSPLLTDYSAEPIETEIDENLTDISWMSSFGMVKEISSAVESFKNFWKEQFLTLHKNEEELNNIFIELYGLEDELTPDVPYNEITILQEELDSKALKKNQIQYKEDEIIRQFISYAVGCIFGRYSLDVDGLVLANAGDGVEEYLKLVPKPSFMPDESGILPITEEDDFSDDLPSQFRNFLRVSFGEENFQENLRYIEEVLGKSIREYLRNNFYKDHVQRYKKRPIYWMITSPSGALKALIYLHRYTKDTINVFLNDYLRPFEQKIEYKIKGLSQVLVSASSSASEKTKAQKQIDKLNKVKTELETWERDVVYDLAVKRIEIDLDDGVKVNYGKLGSILETVKGLNG